MSKLSLYLFSYILLLSLGFIILRYLVPRDYLKRGKLSPFATFLQTLLFFVHGGFPYLYQEKDWPAVSVSPFTHVTGVSVVSNGLAFLLHGMLRLGVVRSMVAWNTPIVAIGHLRCVKKSTSHSMWTLYVFGFFMLWPSWYAAGWAFLYFVLIHMMVLTEEEHLRRIHGQKYQEYCEKVPRYLGPNSFCKNASA